MTYWVNHTEIYCSEKQIWKIHRHNTTHKILEAEQEFDELFVKYFIKNFADISYENASFPELPISEYSTWQLLNYKLVCGMYFSD